MKIRKSILVLLLVGLLSSTGVFAANSGAAKVTGPVKVTLWHTRGAGPNGDAMAAAVKKFNATNKLGITVEEVFQGNYPTSLAKIMQSIAAGTNPQMVILERAAGVPVMATQNILQDMNPYIKRDHFNMNNFPKVLLGFSYYKGQTISLPFIRSTPVFYYNKGMFAKAGFKNPPKTYNELVTIGKKVAEIKNGTTNVYGFELLNDPAWHVQNMLYQLGSNILSKDGKSSPCLEDGKLLKVLSAWRQWVDDGWCAAPTVTNGETNMKDQFNQGKIASFIMSCGGMASILKTGKDAGIDVGVSFLPTMGKPGAPTGGGNLAIIKKNNSPQQIAAAWEFMKFLMSDEQVASNAANTGYLPATISSTKTPIIKKLWAEHPQYKVAFEQLSIAQELPWSPYKSEFEEVMTNICSNLIMDRSITAKQAVVNLKREATVIFPRKKK